MIGIRRIWRPYRTCFKCVTSLNLKNSQDLSFSKHYSQNPWRPLEVSNDETKPNFSKTGNSGKTLLGQEVTRTVAESGYDSSDVKKENKDALMSVLSHLMTNKKEMIETKILEQNEFEQFTLAVSDEEIVQTEPPPVPGTKHYSLAIVDHYFRTHPSRYPFYKAPVPESKILELASQPESNKIKEQLRIIDKENKMEMFKIFCCSSEQWDEFSQQQIFSKLKIEDLSYDQIETVLQHCCFINTNQTSKSFGDLKRRLRDRSVQLLKTTDKSQSFRLASLWLQFHFRNNFNLHSCRFLDSFVNQFADGRASLMSLEPPEFAFLMFISGCLRFFPGCEHTSTLFDPYNGFTMPGYLQGALDSKMPKMTFEELGFVAHAIHKAHFHLRTPNKSITSFLAQAIVDVPESKIASSEYFVSSITKILRSRGLRQQDFVSKAMTKYSPHLIHFGFETKTRFLSMLQSGCPANYQWFLKVFVNSIDTFDGVRIKHLEQTAFALYFFNFNDVNFSDSQSKIYVEMMNAIERMRLNDVRNCRSMIYLTCFLIKCGIYRTSHIKTIFDAANSTTELLRPHKSSDDFFESAMSVFWAMMPSDVARSSNRHNREKVRSKELTAGALFAIAEIDLTLEIRFPDYVGTRLNESVRKGCLSSKKSSRFLKGTDIEEVRDDVLRNLKSLFGEKIYSGVLFPHSSYRDLAMCLDVSTELRFIAKDHNLVEDTLHWEVVRTDSPAEGHQWFAVVVPKVNNFVEDTHQPLGPIIYKKNILEALGYQVIIINPYEWNQLREKGKARNFLFDKFLLKAKESNICHSNK